MNEKTQKYTVLFYTNYWVKAGLERVLAIILPELAKCYNVILATNASGTKEGFELPVQILHIFTQQSLPFHCEPGGLAQLRIPLEVLL